jgi:cell division protein FtsZ
MGTGSARGDNRAREAAEMAIGSPLLEDVDLQGARGILVNVTAGLDLSLGEFTEVGEVIEEFASEHATVVVGTVIDPELSDELRVTVVATGLGIKETNEKPKKVVDNTAAPAVTVRKVPTTAADYAELDKPAHVRQQAASAAAPKVSSDKAKDMDYLDIPAFLRRQAD